MSFPGPFPVTQVAPSSSQELSIRLNERITARVMEVTPSQAILDIKGYPVVARLTSKDQVTDLLSKKFANLVISEVTSDQITLKILNETGTQSTAAPIQLEMGDWAARISESLGLEGTQAEIQLIQSALTSHIPITKEIISNLLDTIKNSGVETNQGIELAVKLQSAGLPVTVSSLQLAAQFGDVQIGDSFQALLTNLKTLAAQKGNDPQLMVRVQNLTQNLQALVPDSAMGMDKFRDSLQQLFQFLGKPYEKILNEKLSGENIAAREPFNLVTVAQMAKDLRQAGFTGSADTIDRFLEEARQVQYLNIKPAQEPGKGQWAELAFVVQQPDGRLYQTNNARIKISYRHEQKTARIDPDFTNLFLQVELAPGKLVGVDLSLFQKKVSAEISAEDDELRGIFSQSMPEFSDLLTGMGYDVVGAKVSKKRTEGDRQISLQTIDLDSSSSLDIEV
jgi:hypothetical protein